MNSRFAYVKVLLCLIIEISSEIKTQVLAEDRKDVLIPLESWFNAVENINENRRRHAFFPSTPDSQDEQDSVQYEPKSLEVTELNTAYEETATDPPVIIKRRKKIKKNIKVKKVPRKKLDGNRHQEVQKYVKRNIRKKKKNKQKDGKHTRRSKVVFNEAKNSNSSEFAEIITKQKKGKPVDIVVHIKMSE